MPFRVPTEEELSERLVAAARETRRLWAVEEVLEAIEAALLTQEIADDLIREAVGNARSIGTPWEQIAARLGATRQAAWQKFNFADQPKADRPKEGHAASHSAPSGRQAYFRKLLVQVLKHDFPGAPAALDDLYKIVSETADPGWVDEAPCRHNKAQREWQHDLRWSLLQLKGTGEVRQPARGRYELAS